MSVNGIFNVNKPQGITSFGVVAAMRRLTRERRIGHAGTLDPLAVGVLPVCVGQATKVVEFLTGSSKAYCAEIVLGASTDTDDTEGRLIAESDPSGITLTQIEEILSSFVGKIQQVPPKFSAIKVGGKKLYELARAGAEFEPKAREVEIHRIRLICFELPVFVIEVDCSKGTYVRSLARDIGAKLGVGAHLSNLVRTRSGPFTLDDAVPLSEIAQAFELDYWRSIIYPVDEALAHWDAIVVGPERERAIYNGQSIPVAVSVRERQRSDSRGERTAVEALPQACRAYGFDGRLIAVLDLDETAELWRPRKVFSLRD